MTEAEHSIVRRLGPAGVLGVLAVTLPIAGTAALFWATANTGLGAWLRANEWQGVGVYVLAFAVLGGLALLPTYAQSALGGWAFGLMLGAPAALAGFLGGAIIGYAIARRASGDRVEAIIEEKPRWKAVRDALAGPVAGSGREGRGFWKTLLMVTLIRVPPNSPFALTNLVLASVKVPWGPYVLGTLLGMTPRTVLAVLIGAGVQSAMTKDALDHAMPKWVLWFAIGSAAVVVIVVGAVANRAIERVAKMGVALPEKDARR